MPTSGVTAQTTGVLRCVTCTVQQAVIKSGFLIDTLSHSLTHSPHPPTHPPPPPPPHPPTHSRHPSAHSLACSLTHSLIQSITHPPIHPLKHSFPHSHTQTDSLTHPNRQSGHLCLHTDLLVAGAGLDGQHPCVGGCQSPVDGGQAVHVLWSVLQHAVPSIAVLRRVHWHGLKAPPA